MRNYLRNLLAALRGRRGQAVVTVVAESFQRDIDRLTLAQQDIDGEIVSTEVQISALYNRQSALYADRGRATRLVRKLKEFVA